MKVHFSCYTLAVTKNTGVCTSSKGLFTPSEKDQRTNGPSVQIKVQVTNTKENFRFFYAWCEQTPKGGVFIFPKSTNLCVRPRTSGAKVPPPLVNEVLPNNNADLGLDSISYKMTELDLDCLGRNLVYYSLNFCTFMESFN